MKFSLQQSLLILERTPFILKKLLSGLDEDWILSNEGPDTWSPFDVICHLLHGDRTDWLVRVKIILGPEPKPDFKPFDRFAQYEESRGKALETLLNDFEQVRKINLEELKSFNLQESDLSKTGVHPKFGTVTLKNLIATWAIHDLSHLSQISRVMARQYKEEVGPWLEYMPILQN